MFLFVCLFSEQASISYERRQLMPRSKLTMALFPLLLSAQVGILAVLALDNRRDQRESRSSIHVMILCCYSFVCFYLVRSIKEICAAKGIN